MLPVLQQQALVAQYAAIPDAHERLALVLERSRRRPCLESAQRTEAQRVKGCVSRVWLVCALVEGRCRFAVDADSALVRGLAWIICDVYDGATPAEVAEYQTHVLEELGLAVNLSPTRLHGLGQLCDSIRNFGTSQISTGAGEGR